MNCIYIQGGLGKTTIFWKVIISRKNFVWAPNVYRSRAVGIYKYRSIASGSKEKLFTVNL